MARIQDLLDGDLIIEDLQATDKTGVIREIASFLKSRGKVRDEDEVFDIVMRRESTTTGIGEGIANPHGRMKDLPGVIVVFGRSRKGVDFQSMDGKPAHLFFLFITPENRPEDHLAVLRRLARITRDPVLREQLLRSTDRREMQKLILDADERYPNCR
jgi:mannitol/fructose-specific phosphotransferase system IIA component (Ntr-type)